MLESMIHSVFSYSAGGPSLSYKIADHAAVCCWSKWGDVCGNYPSGASGGKCTTDWTKTCNGNSDCPVTPVTPPPPPPPPPGPSRPKPPPPMKWPEKVVGLYLLIADD